ncbi:MAG TPA: transcriptional regulator GcvA [Geminicoccus sp.]|jgi:LysR family glycine cleavage system transcriptional activator|uniref:transcriptional regulator GcvA n=1 Tax=Geminicoccus sp. TaxID=2024832 RepID=UPI002E357665|nr:transcriptional regulator GcvA [Geminicoccus sp.]HEX2528837.1 transcriptional regulator GcvA [Geminicoccus sp.]
MARRIPALNTLRTFEIAARHLNFTRAAEELHVTPAAVSAQIRSLEDQLGVRLFLRTSRSVRLSSAGSILLAAVEEAMTGLAEAMERVVAGAKRPAFKISTSYSFAAKWLVPRLHRFRAEHPGLDVHVDANDRLVDLTRDEVDVAIRFGSGVYPGLRVDRLFEEEVFPVCSPRLAQGDPPLREPSDLRLHALIHEGWRAQGDVWPDWRMWLLAAGLGDIEALHGIHYHQSALAIQAAIDGQGIALSTTSLVADDLAAGRLVQPFELSLSVPQFSYFLVAPKRSRERPGVTAFRTWILAEVSSSTAAIPGPAARDATECASAASTCPVPPSTRPGRGER